MAKLIKNICKAMIILFFVALNVGCNKRNHIILYEYYLSNNQSEHKQDTILGQVGLPIVELRHGEVASRFREIFNELSKDSISSEYKMIVRLDNDTIKFSIQSWGADLSIGDELRQPKLHYGIIKHRTDNETKDFFVIYARNSVNPERVNEIFKPTGGMEYYELRRHYLPYNVHEGRCDDMQYYYGFYTNDSIVLLRKREREINDF